MALTQPFGMNTALSPNNPGGRGMSGLVTNERERAKDYQRANRLLRRAARRGDINAAVNLVKFGDMASKAGYQVSGITSAEGNVAGAMSNIGSRLMETRDRAAAAQANRNAINGNAAVGAGAGPQGQVGGTMAPSRGSFAEQEAAAQKRSMLSGAFGSRGAKLQAARDRQAASALVDSAITRTIGGDLNDVTAVATADEDVIQASLDKVRALGGSEASFRNAIANRIQETPEMRSSNAALPNVSLGQTTVGSLINPPELSPQFNPVVDEISSLLQRPEDPSLITPGKSAELTGGYPTTSDTYDPNETEKRIKELEKRRAKGLPIYAPSTNYASL